MRALGTKGFVKEMLHFRSCRCGDADRIVDGEACPGDVQQRVTKGPLNPEINETQR